MNSHWICDFFDHFTDFIFVDHVSLISMIFIVLWVIILLWISHISRILQIILHTSLVCGLCGSFRWFILRHICRNHIFLQEYRCGFNDFMDFMVISLISLSFHWFCYDFVDFAANFAYFTNIFTDFKVISLISLTFHCFHYNFTDWFRCQFHTFCARLYTFCWFGLSLYRFRNSFRRNH